MSDLPSVSVIIAAYDAAPTLADTLESVLAQTSPNWEAIVVDDGSHDATVEIANSFAARDSRIHVVIRAENGGESAARNTGIDHAQSDWLLFLDSDDWIAPTHLERMTSELAAHPEFDAVHCGSVRVASDGTQVADEYQPPAGDLFPVLARRAAFPVNACIVRRSLVLAVGKLDTSLAKSPDWDLWQRIARAGARFGAVPEVLAFYRMTPNSSSLDAEKMFRDGLRVLRRGHAPDPRVPNPHPDYVNGLVGDSVESQVFYLLCWSAGLVLGSGKDARPLLDPVREYHYPHLYADAIAKCIYDSATLPSSQPREVWIDLFPRIAPAIGEFLQALESQSQTEGLADAAVRELKVRILARSPIWQSVIERLVKEREEERSRLTAQLHSEKAVLESELSEAHRRESRLEQDLSAQHERASALAGELADRERELAARDQELAARDQELAARDQELAARDRDLADRDRELADRERELADRGRQLADLERELTDRRRQLADLGRELADRGRRLADLERELAERGRRLVDLERELADRERELADRERELADRERELNERESELEDTRRQHAALEDKLQQLSSESRIQKEAAEREVELLEQTLERTRDETDELATEKESTKEHLRRSQAAVAAGEQKLAQLREHHWVRYGIALHLLDPAHLQLPGSPPPPSNGQPPAATSEDLAFQTSPDSESVWQLEVAPGNDAILRLADGHPETMRVEIARAAGFARWSVQLNRCGLKIDAGHRRSLGFRARAARPRTIGVGLAKACPPWSNLGFYTEIRLTTNWQAFLLDVLPSESDANARIHFDLGGRRIPVDLADIAFTE